MRRTPPRVATYAVTLGDQALFGIAGFGLSWVAANTLDVDGLARFAIAWQWALGAAALGSETLVTPATIAVSRAPHHRPSLQDPVLALLVALSVASVVLGAAGPGGTTVALVALVMGAACGALAFTLVRALNYAMADPPASLRISGVRAVVTAVLLGGVLAGDRFTPRTALIVGSTAFLVPVAGYVRRTSLAEVVSTVRGLAGSGAPFALGTGAQVLGFTAGMLLLLELVRGSGEAGVAAGLFILVGPIQLLSASLPILFMAELAAARTAVETRSLIRRHVGVVVLTLAVGLSGAAILYSPWVDLTIGDLGLRERLGEDFVAFASLASGVLAVAYLSAALKALERPRQFVAAVVLGAAAGWASVVMGIATAATLVVPFAVTTVLMSVALVGAIRDLDGPAAPVHAPEPADRTGPT